LLQHALGAIDDVAAEPPQPLASLAPPQPVGADAAGGGAPDLALLRQQCASFRINNATGGTIDGQGVVHRNGQRLGRVCPLGKNAWSIACSQHPGCRRILPANRIKPGTIRERASWYFWVGTEYETADKHVALLDLVVL
jgi:hypothetical protein